MLKFISRNSTPPKGFRYHQPETDMPFVSMTSYEALQGLVESHRRAVNFGQARHGITLDLEEGWKQRLERDVCLQRGEDGFCQDPENPQPFKSELERLGRALWLSLHSHALEMPETLNAEQQKGLLEWLARWERQVPSWPSSCNCRHEWEQIRKEVPVDVTGRDAFYTWTSTMHSRISALLGKPEWVSPPSGDA